MVCSPDVFAYAMLLKKVHTRGMCLMCITKVLSVNESSVNAILAVCRRSCREQLSVRGLFVWLWLLGTLSRKIKSPQVLISRLKSETFSTQKYLNLEEYSNELIRNFCIIAHVDHGKSTLADRLLEMTGAIVKSKHNKQILDKLQVERERGITVKAQSASIFYKNEDETYLLNLIDTPGHVDFHYEVKRSLAACQGVILLVDANEGVQAQTVANFYLAFELDLPVLPVLNKIDLKVAKPEIVLKQLHNIFDINPDSVLKISAKNGSGVDKVLEAIVDRIPPPPKVPEEYPLKALLFDSHFDQFKGAIANIAVKEGTVKQGDKILSLHGNKLHDVQEVGILTPEPVKVVSLIQGQVGYLVANMKQAKEALIGDTLCLSDQPVKALPGFKAAQPMVYAGVFPTDQASYSALKDAIQKLTLNDASVQINIDHSAALGQGWRLGFLGLLHMDVFEQRLQQEFNIDTIVTAPNVPYKVKVLGAKNVKKYGGEFVTVLNPCHMPPRSIIEEIHEPFVLGTIITPDHYLSEMMSLFMEYRGVMHDQSYIDDTRLMFKVVFPLNEVILTFFDNLKALTSGYGSFDYEDYGYKIGNLVKLEFLINDVIAEELTTIIHYHKAEAKGREICLKLKENISRQQFEFPIRAQVNGRIICRETVKAYRKDVTAKVKSGHDMARKRALLKRQKEGKKKMRMYGHVTVPKDVFIKVLKK